LDRLEVLNRSASQRKAATTKYKFVDINCASLQLFCQSKLTPKTYLDFPHLAATAAAGASTTSFLPALALGLFLFLGSIARM